MLSALRKKFVIINMAFVGIVLLVVFIAICITNYRQSIAETNRSLDRVLEMRGGMEMDFPKPKIDRQPDREFHISIPVFMAVLAEDNTVLYAFRDNVDVSDEVLSEAIEKALQSDGMSGILSGLNLRYKMLYTKEGTKIAFADRSSEIHSMKSLFFSSAIIALGSFLAFFAISLYLSVWALRPVEKAWEQQKQFVANASHELKTPVTVILANTGILLNHPEEQIKDYEKWLYNTQAEADRIKELVDGMLYLAKSDEERISAKFLPVNLSDVAWNSVLPFESVAFENGITIKTDIDADIFVKGDETGLRQLVGILMDNACKYAGANGTVRISLHREQDKAVLAIQNNGQSIAPDDLEHIFERFYRGDKSRQRGGYGLGLSIAKGIIDNHHGKIKAESSAGAMTQFIISFPCRAWK